MGFCLKNIINANKELKRIATACNTCIDTLGKSRRELLILCAKSELHDDE